MSNLQTCYEELVKEYSEYSVLGSVAGLLHWDMQAIMPPKGVRRRTDQLALIAGIMHKRLTSPRMGELLEKLKSADGLSEIQLANVREIRRDHDLAALIPSELVEELSRQRSIGHEVWVRAREKADFSLFAPELEKLVELSAKEAEYLGYADTPLDALIDQFEPKATVAMFTKLFDELKAANVPLLNKVLSSSLKPNRGFLRSEYPVDLQKQFGQEVMRQLGFDMDAGRLDTSVHPFCAGSCGDIRITTRYSETAPQQALFGIVHETGHALYEQNVDERYWGSPLAEALSYGIHESQSRLWENLVGRSRPFWTHFLSKLSKVFPAQLSGVTVDSFLLAINHVERSFVRVEADELTYDLHIILRFEIERDLFARKISVSDLPTVWNRKMENYLGITPPNDGKLGVLQDVHWSQGSFGYFPSYSLGNIAAAQLWYAMRDAMPDMDNKIASGDFRDVLAWLREKVHLLGRQFTRDELLRKATGNPLGTGDYIRYLTEKYSALYRV